MKKLLKIIQVFSLIILLLFLEFSFSYKTVNAVELEKNKNNKENYTEEDKEDSKLSKDYKEYLKLSDEEKSKLNIIPRKYEVNFDEFFKGKTNSHTNEIRATINQNIPKKFDLRDEINVEVENQSLDGLCWDFASTKCLETNLALNGYGDYDFSERHVDYLESNEFGKARDLHGGGFFGTYEDYLMNNYGPVLEEEVPYDSSYSIYEYEKLLGMEPKAFVNETIDFPSIYKESETYTEEQLQLFRNEVKKHIINNGSLYATIYAPDESINFNKETNAENNVNYIVPNHAVSIIGWDDNYSKDNFKEGCKPQNNGAYIVLNSWGEDWGDKGVFYVSYEDINIERTLSGIVSASTNEDVFETIFFSDINLYNAIKEELKNKIQSYDDNTLSIKISKITIEGTSSLNLSGKNITNLSGIEKFTELTELNLSDNNISDIKNLKNLYNLENLNLENNNINDINNLKDLLNLKKLNLENNNISNIDNLRSLCNLEILNLGDNNISNINTIDGFDKISELYLNNNNIIDVSNISLFPGHSEYDKTLDLSGNTNLDILTLQNLNNVEILLLENCQLNNSIVDIVGNMSLNEISLANNNNITDVSGLDPIWYINLSGNTNLDVSTIPVNSGLNLSDCNISDLSFLNKKNYMFSLNLSNNPLNDEALDYLEDIKITILDISYTNIKNIGRLNVQQELDVSGNEDVYGLNQMPTNLQILKMNECKLNNLDILNGCNFSDLHTIELKGNNLKDIKALNNITSLYDINLENNSIKSIEGLVEKPYRR